MKSTRIYNLIKDIEQCEDIDFNITVEGVGKFEGTRDELLPMLINKYTDIRLEELKSLVRAEKLSQRKISALMGINPVVFTQFLTGFVKSNKQIGDTTQFIWKVEKIISNNKTACKR